MSKFPLKLTLSFLSLNRFLFFLSKLLAMANGIVRIEISNSQVSKTTQTLKLVPIRFRAEEAEVQEAKPKA